MEYLKIGKTDISASKICYGCWAIGGYGYGEVNDKDSTKAIHTALDLGVNTFDTADVYGFGHSEKILGKALRNKENVIIATKFGVKWDDSGKTKKDCSVKQLYKSIHNSLRRLKRERIDLYQIHWHDGVTPIDELILALVDLKTQGKINLIGASNLSLELFTMATKVARIECAQLPYCLNDFHKEEDIRVLSDKYAVTTLLYGALGRGILSGKYDRRSVFNEKDTRGNDPGFNENMKNNLILLESIKRIAEKYEKTVSQVVIRWTLQSMKNSSILLGMKTPSQVFDNMGSLGWSLNEEDFSALKAEALALFPMR